MSKKKNGKNETALAQTDAIGAELVTGIAPDPSTLVEDITPQSLKGMTIERVVTIDPGKMITGTYLGKGPLIEIADPVTGEVRELATHRFEIRPGVVGRVIESHQLARELTEDKVGEKLRVMKLGQVSTRKGRRVNDWVVGPVA